MRRRRALHGHRPGAAAVLKLQVSGLLIGVPALFCAPDTEAVYVVLNASGLSGVNVARVPAPSSDTLPGTDLFTIADQIDPKSQTLFLKVLVKPLVNLIWLAGGDFAPPAGSEGEARHREIRKGIQGNICRCTGYVNIVESVKWAAEKMGGKNVSR